MKTRNRWLSIVILSTLLLAACSPIAKSEPVMEKEPVKQEKTDSMAAPTEDKMMAPTEDKMMAKTPDAMTEKTPEAMMDSPAWMTAELTDVRTGKTIKVADFKGKVVLIETLATWCPNCLKQQKEVKSLHAALNQPEDLITIGLNVDPNESQDLLKSYVDKNGFDWLYAISPVDVSREISKLYGEQFLNPSSTPMLVIDRSGKVQTLPFGFKSVDDLKQVVEPLLKAGM